MDKDKLQNEFMDFWDEYKDKVGLGNYSDEVTRFWLKKLDEQKQTIIAKIEKLGKGTIWSNGKCESCDEYEDTCKCEYYNEAIEDVLNIIKK